MYIRIHVQCTYITLYTYIHIYIIACIHCAVPYLSIYTCTCTHVQKYTYTYIHRVGRVEWYLSKDQRDFKGFVAFFISYQRKIIKVE